MSTKNYSVLGQSMPAANQLTDLFTVGATLQAVTSTLVICNQSSSAADTFRVAVRPAGAAIQPADYLYYDKSIAANDSLPLALALTLNAGDVVSVQSAGGNVSFNLFGAILG